MRQQKSSTQNNMSEIKEIINALTKFRDERDWKQFHNSKDLSIALSIEVAELNELFLWKNGDDIKNIDLSKIEEELADVLIYAFLLADRNNLDVKEIIMHKIRRNGDKYPVDKAKGSSKKYTEL